MVSPSVVVETENWSVIPKTSILGNVLLGIRKNQSVSNYLVANHQLTGQQLLLQRGKAFSNFRRDQLCIALIHGNVNGPWATPKYLS